MTMRAWRFQSRKLQWFESATLWRPFSSSRAHHLDRRASVAQLLDLAEEDKNVEVSGWVRSVRKQKKIAFASVADGSTAGAVQVVLQPEQASNLSYGAAVNIVGSWQASQGGKQSHELHATAVQILGANDAENSPLQPKYQTAEYLRTIPHLRARVPVNTLALRLRSQVIASLTNFFNDEGFVQAHTPVITSSDCEGAGEVFTISTNTGQQLASPARDGSLEQHFFRSPKYLTVSAQLHLEALSQAVGKVWTLSPTFRAERSDTPRHLSEFYMLEAEVCFAADLEDIMDLMQRMLSNVGQNLLCSKLGGEILRERTLSNTRDEAAEDLTSADVLQRRWKGLTSAAWPRITYAEAIATLETAVRDGTAFAVSPTYNDGLQAEHERYLANHYTRNMEFPCPIFVTDYPAAQKPFYMSPSGSADRNGATVSCFDVIVASHLELAGGSMREHRPEELHAAMQEKGMTGNSLDWYMALRQFGSAPHGGFGLGFDRLLCYLAGIDSVRDMVTFPRWSGRCDC